MLKNYLRSTLRKLVKDKQYTTINIVGLSTGLLLFMAITVYVLGELSIDKHHKNYENTYRVNVRATNSEGEQNRLALSYPPLAEVIRQDLSGVEAVTNFFSPAAQLSFRTGDELISVENDLIYFTDDNFFEVFDQDWIFEGKKLSDPNTVVISDKLAQKFFGDENPVGEVITYKDPRNSFSLQIEGVFSTEDRKSHLAYDLLINDQSSINFWRPGLSGNWSFLYVYTYFTLQENTDKATVFDGLSGLREKYLPERTINEFEAQALSDLYFDPVSNEPGLSGNMNYIFIFGSFAFVLLLLASVNFINLMTARSIGRSKEVAVRKVVGAGRFGLMFQFLSESIILSYLAMLFACVGFERLIPVMNNSLKLDLSFRLFSDPILLVIVFVSPMIIGLLSGVYPALVLSALKAKDLLKSKSGWTFSGEGLRKGLLAFQFLIAILVISGVAMINKQIDFIRSEGIGFKENPVLVLPRIANSNNILIEEALEANPNITGFSAVSAIPGYRTPRVRNFKEKNSPGEGEVINGLWVSLDYAEILDLTFSAGRNFEQLDDSQTMILNEKAVQSMGWSAQEAVGKEIVLTGRNGFDPTAYKVIGVTQDYHYGSLYEVVEPLFLLNDSQNTTGGNASIVEISKDNFEAGLSDLRNVWSGIEKNEGFDYYFLDDAMNDLYAKEIKLSKVVSYTSVVAMIICALGLYGLVTLSLSSRKKEIGIRKVLGATGTSIVTLISTLYGKLLMLSIVIGLPISYFLLDSWLQNFAYRIQYSFFQYATIGLIVMAVCFLIVGAQSLRASFLNPVDSLRDE